MGEKPQVIQTFKTYSTVAILLLIALPTASQEILLQEYYYCDDLEDNTCIIEGIDDLSHWRFDPWILDELVDTIKFTSAHFDEITSDAMFTDNKDQYPTTTIDLSGNHIKIVRKFHFTFEGVKIANLSRNQIENLDSSSIFKAHPQLQTLDLSFNRIRSIISDAFHGLSKLNVLNLNDNQLKVITASVFAPLMRLRDLELSGNLIEKFENESFVELVDLQIIFLERNNFPDFNFNMFERNNKLLKISLGDNNGTEFLSLIGNINSTALVVKLTKVMQSNTTVSALSLTIKNSKLSELMIPTVAENVVATNSSITKLHFKDNDSSLQMGDFHKNLLTGQLSFEMCKKLEMLDLSFNQIEDVSFSSNHSLIINLNLSNNNLTRIPPTMTNLSNLQILDLSFNCIENFEIQTFRHMTSLEVLNLRQSCFKSLEYGTFSFQENLRVLDISFNNLNHIDLYLLSVQAKLEDLLIDGNNLTNIQGIDSVDTYFPSLRSMGLTHNNWNCKTLIDLLHELFRANVEVFVETAVSHTTNVRGIGCTSGNSSQQTLLVPKNAMPLNHTAYMSKIEKINGIVEILNQLNDTRTYRKSLDDAIRDLQREKAQVISDYNEHIEELKSFGKGVVHKLEVAGNENSRMLMEMKTKIEHLIQMSDQKYDLIVDNIQSLKDKIQLIQLNEKKYNEKRMLAKENTKRESDYQDALGTLRTLEIILIASIFVLFAVALYYVYVYC